MKHLYFCRHGLTQANEDGIWSGTMETPLTATGKAQAKLAGKHAKNLGIDYIICSTLGRARETADIIAKEIGFPPEKIEHNSFFIERHFGQMEGEPYQFDADTDGFIDVETKDTILNRARLALRHIETLPAENVLIVSHGSFGRAFRSLIHTHIPYETSNPDPKHKIHNADVIQLI